MNQLTFGDGTFAGMTIRTTSDGYASIYDIIRVAGVGRDPFNVWTELKGKCLRVSQGIATGTSDSRQPSVKKFKFSGRGQRDTPVFNGPGLVRLLFLLPGVNARKFVAESAETLVRHLGGDETLIEQIRHNREIAQQTPDSMNQLTFGDGTFAGKTIRTTSDGYASIYDVMRVAGVGRDPFNVWTELKGKFLKEFAPPITRPFKFPGRGQRDTPTINGPGLVRLLFLLPGQRSRAFVAESAETLIRFLGGDETLVDEIRRNREIAIRHPNSAQAFMENILVKPIWSTPISRDTGGYLYILNIKCVPTRVKIGHTHHTLERLRYRYHTAFPDQMRIYAVEVDDSFLAEQEVHAFFAAHRQAGEWFSSIYLSEYIEYLEQVFGPQLIIRDDKDF